MVALACRWAALRFDQCEPFDGQPSRTVADAFRPVEGPRFVALKFAGLKLAGLKFAGLKFAALKLAALKFVALKFAALKLVALNMVAPAMC